MMKIFRVLVVVLLLPHMAACGGATTRQVSSDDAADATPRAAAASERSEDDADRKDTEAPKESAAPEEVAAEGALEAEDEPEASPKATPKNTMQLSVAMDPSCVRRTERTTMTVKAERFSDVSYGVSYADGQNHGQYGIGRTDAAGVLKKTFIVPMKAAVGEATVLVAAMNADTRHGGSAQDTFEVASTSC